MAKSTPRTTAAVEKRDMDILIAPLKDADISQFICNIRANLNR
jgi:hypothetical protein